jgi:hypothetical protein
MARFQLWHPFAPFYWEDWAWEVPTTIIVGREKHPISRMHTKLTLIWTPIDTQFVLECVIAGKYNLRSF